MKKSLAIISIIILVLIIVFMIKGLMKEIKTERELANEYIFVVKDADYFINGRLRLLIDGKIYWIKLEEQINYTDEKILEEYIIDTTGEELYFYDTDSIVRIEISPAPTAIAFGNDVGTLSWEEGIMRFEGDAEESAKIFFDYFLVMYIEEYIENEVKMRMQIPKTFDMPLDKNIEYGTEENLEAVEEWDNLDITNSDGRLDSGETFIIYTKLEDIMYLFSCNIDGFKPTKFLEITGVDMSECYIDGRLRVVIDDEICWIRLEID
jgi:hypothetical protein